MGLVLFVVVVAWSWVAVGGIELRWSYVVVLAVLGAPLMVGTMVVEQHVSTYLAGVRVSWWSSFQTSVLATASNYLPVPGAVLVRVGALKKAGSGLGRATAAAALLGATWLMITVVAGAPAMISSDYVLLGWSMLLVGSLGTVSAVVFYVRRYSLDPTVALVSIGVVCWKVVLHAMNTYLALLAVGADTTPADAALIGTAGVIASAVGLFPGGLGVRELVAGVLAGVVGLDPALGALAAVVTRAVMTAWIGAAAAVAVGVSKSSTSTDGDLAAEEEGDSG